MLKITLFLFYSCLCVFASAEQLLNVHVSIPPQKYIVEKIGDEHVNVHVMVAPGETPETFSPTPKKLSALADSVLYFRMNLPFENVWIEAIRNANKDLKMVDCCNALFDNDPIDDDFHLWTDPHNVISIARLVKQELINSDPVNEKDYEKKFDELRDALEELIVFIHKKLKYKRTSYFLVAHASWGHYAKAFGLKQLALERNAGHAGPGTIGDLIKIAKREKIHTVFIQDRIDPSNSRIFANEIGADLIVLDPLAEDYITNMKEVTLKISKAIQ